MSAELTLLTWTLILAIAQIAIVAALRTRETGLPYNAGPRDTPSPVPVGIVTGRLIRAQRNLFETLPIFIALILIAQTQQIHTSTTQWGATLYFWSRLIYVPLYACGIPYARTLIWTAGVVGLLMLLSALF